MNLFDRFQHGLPFEEFLTAYGTSSQQDRWRKTCEETQLIDTQKDLLRSFKREMKVMILAGVWCGDCSSQCPIFERFAEFAPPIQIRYFDRDVHAEIQKQLQINGGNRVPVVVFFSEDGYEVSRFGERTLSRYRQLIRDQVGESCATGIAIGTDPLLKQVTQDWLNEFERAQWILRLSPRLRQKHRD